MLAKAILLLGRTRFNVVIGAVFLLKLLLLNFGVGDISGVAIVDFVDDIVFWITMLLNIRGLFWVKT